MTRRPAASRRAAAAITSMTMNAGTSLRAEADSHRFAFSGRLALSSMMALMPAKLGGFRLRQLHQVAESRVYLGSASATAPLSPHLPDWYRHVRRPILPRTNAHPSLAKTPSLIRPERARLI